MKRLGGSSVINLSINLKGRNYATRARDKTDKSIALEAINQALILFAQMEVLKVDGEELGSVMKARLDRRCFFCGHS